MDRYFLKLKEDNPVQRVNWTCMFLNKNLLFFLYPFIFYLVQIGNNLCQRKMEENEVQLITKDNAGQLMYLRVERQTLRRLPISNTILFTIKTYTTKIEDVCRNEPDTTKRLASALRNWPPEMIEYKVMQLYIVN